MSESSLLASIVDRTADPASVAWAHAGQGDLAALPDPLAAIAAAAKLGNSAALQGVSAPKELRKAAGAALHKLKSQGVKILAAAPPRAFSLGKEDIDLRSRAFVSNPDREGELELLLTTSDATGNCALAVILGPRGVRETRHGHLSRGEVRGMWRDAEARPELTELPYVAALHYADAAFAGPAPAGHDGQASTAAQDWRHFLGHVPMATLTSARILDPLAMAPAGMEEEETGNLWMAPISLLSEAALRDGLIAIVTAVAEHADASGDAAALDAHLEALYANVSDAALAGGDRAALTDAAELSAAVFAFRGRPLQAAQVRAQGEEITAGAPGSAINGVALGVRLFLLTQAQQDLYAKFTSKPPE